MESQNNLNLISLIKDFTKSLKGKLIIGLTCLALILILVLVITNILRSINKQKNIAQNPPLQQNQFTPQPASKNSFSDNIIKPEIDTKKQILVQLSNSLANATPSASFQIRSTDNKTFKDLNLIIKAKNSQEKNYKTITGNDLIEGIKLRRVKLVPVMLFQSGEKGGTSLLGYEYYTPVTDSQQKTIVEFEYAGYHFTLSFI